MTVNWLARRRGGDARHNAARGRGDTLPGTMSMPPFSKSISRLPLALLMIALSACTVAYRPPPGGPPPPPPVAGRPDMTGWRLMGEAWVNGQVDRDFIRVGKYEGRFARIMLVVTDADLELHDMIIQFGNGQRWAPGIRYLFREGSRSRAIDLPGHVRFIRDVELVYGNVTPGRRAHAELWGQ
jgi:hypothetical protein